ncbi:MAG: choice-of-anchor D domain-containing protein [Planctomycetia bacterium]|nr:choice-of-anchor D domain-containing protein [Planctomycetia bacterium]
MRFRSVFNTKRARNLGRYRSRKAPTGKRVGSSLEFLEDRRMMAIWIPEGPGPITGGQVAGLTSQQNPVTGAVNALAANPSDPNIVYLGAVNGGIWRTTNATALNPTWTPLTDHNSSLSIGALEFDPTDPTNNTLIAGIGRFSSNLMNGGPRTGLLRTTDGGITWTEINGGGTLVGKNVTSVAERGNTIVVAENDADQISLSNVGIFRSTDGGASFVQISGRTGTGLPLGRSFDMQGDPTDPAILFDSVVDAGASDGIYKSTNQGATWSRVSSPAMNALFSNTPTVNTDNVEMSVGKVHNVYVGIDNNGQLAGFFRSGDGGGTWTAMDLPTTNDNGQINGLQPTTDTGPANMPTESPGGQGEIHFSVVADPNNSNLVYVGGDRQPNPFPNSIGSVDFSGRLFRGDSSLPAGSQWTPLTDNFADPDGGGPLPGTAPHADSRDMTFDAAGNIIEGDDGGIYKRASPASASGVWTSLIGNLQVTEFNSVAYDSNTRTLFGGAQDTGTSEQIGPGSTAWREVLEGDGGIVAIDDSMAGQSLRYGSFHNLLEFGFEIVNSSNVVTGGKVANLIVNGTGGQTIYQVDFPQFYSPVQINRIQPTRLVFGTENNVFESFDRGDTLNNLGVVGFVTTMAYGGTAAGVPNPDALYVGTDRGLFFRANLAAGLNRLAAFPGATPVGVVMDPRDWHSAYVIDSRNRVFHTANAGQSWTNITGNLVDSQLRSIEFINGNNGRAAIAVGGNEGVHILRLGAGNPWLPAGTELPNAPVMELHYNVKDDVLVAATAGRGAWMVSQVSTVLLQGGLSIADETQLEGNAGFTDFVFTVVQQAMPQTVTVAYSTSDGSANAPSDYVAQSGTLTFLPGVTSQQITIKVVGDTIVESDEDFFVTLSNATNNVIDRAQGVGTIFNDDLDVSINDATALEGDVGTSPMVFTLSVIGVSHVTAEVSYATNDDTANAASDYVAQAGTLQITPGTPSVNITVPIIGDLLNESTEDFFVNLSNPINATIIKTPGVGTILDNDPIPVLVVDDVHVTTTQAGEIDAVFAVALNRPSGQDVTVQYATADGSAKNPTNYLAKSGTLDFPAGVTKQLVTVPVLASGMPAPNESFSLNLSTAVHADVLDAQGVGTIIFADPPAGETIVDDGEAGYSQTGGWTNTSNSLAYHLDYDFHAPGDGSDTATWTFANLVPENYQVFLRWLPFANRATNAPYTIFDGSAPEGTVLVNQQLMPSGDMSNGITWQSLGEFSASSGTLSVKLSDNANGYVTADAVRIVAMGIPRQGPEMDVSGGSQSIADGARAPIVDDGTDFGTVAAATNSTNHTFTITNNGNAELHLSGSPRVNIFDILGASSQDFTVIAQPSATVAGGGQSTFQVMFHPIATGLRQAIVSIDNDDASEHPYRFEVQGTGTAPGTGEFVVDDTSTAYRQNGNWVNNNNSLSFQRQYHSDAPGAGNDQANWTFNNLAPGQYQVFTTWTPFGNRATNSPFTIADAAVSKSTVIVNQQQAPTGPAADGVTWGNLGTFSVTSGTLTVSLTNNANGLVVGDAIRIVRPVPPLAPAVVALATPANHNATLPQDVNADHSVTSLDVLLVINNLNSQSASSVPSATPLAAAAAAAPAQSSGKTYFYDVNGDGVVSPRDLLMVINYLLRSSNPPGASPSAALAVQPLSSAATLPAVQLFAAVDQAHSQMGVSAGTETPPSAFPFVSSAPAAAPTSVAPATIITLSPSAVRTVFASSAKKPDSPLESSLGALGV